MILKFSVFLLISQVSAEHAEIQDWDLAVIIHDHIELLTTSGTLVGTHLLYTKLKALIFNNIKQEFTVSNMNQQTNTIYSISLTEEGNYNSPIARDLPDIQSLAIDPLTDILYWTDPKYKSIHSVPLNEPTDTSEVFIKFKEREPQNLAIDSCRRYLYFTNSFIDKPSIDRIHLNTKEHEVLVDSVLNVPIGIAIDYIAQKLYWSDSGPAIRFHIESATLEGRERETVISDKNQYPFGLAVDSEYIYWTDIYNNALWKHKKNHAIKEFSVLRHFEGTPQGIVAKQLGFAGTPDCENIFELMNKYNDSTTLYNQRTEEELFKKVNLICLHNGKQIENHCDCPTGYAGRSCEIRLCRNLCIHGKCELTTYGYPKCICYSVGYKGSRCETNVCDNFCLNNGTCAHDGDEVWGAKCRCRDGFIGSRCEINTKSLCDNVCQGQIEEPKDILCKCNERDNIQITELNQTNPVEVQKLKIVDHGPMEYCKYPVLIFYICVLVPLCFSSILLVRAYKMKTGKRRQRINDPVVVTQIVKTLTSGQPSTTEKCDIMTENIRNMNVGQRSSFEQSPLRKKNAKEENKSLLTNMEN